MKKYIISLLILNVFGSFAQEDGLTLLNNISASEINSRIKLPKSPEADAFEKYGNTPVNLYTGTPDISIPLHTIKGRELDVSMNLTYDASGIKVNQIATSVGLGWNLSVGGRISRIAVGIPDDIVGKGPYEFDNYNAIQEVMNNGAGFNSEGQLENYLNDFMLPVANGVFDTQLDYYSLTIIGINDYIVRDLGTDFYHTLMNPKIRVEHTNSSNWLVTNDDGTEYYFEGKYETTTIQAGDDIPGGGSVYSGTSTSSWLLTKIITKNKMDVFEFDYKLYTWANGFGMPLASRSYTESLKCPLRLLRNSSWNMNSPYSTSQQMPYKIKHNNELIVELSYKARQDLLLLGNSYQGGNALDEIVFFDYNTSLLTPTYSKKIKFIHTYFGDPNLTTYQSKRLKLDSLVVFKTNLDDGKSYSFEYNNPNLIPRIDSNSQDFLGLYNRAINSNLVPGVSYHDLAVQEGANRDFDYNSMIVGTLNKITYPTKGFTVFEFEQNSIPNNSWITDYSYILNHDISYNMTNPTIDYEYNIVTNNQNSANIPSNFYDNYYEVHPNMESIGILNYPNHTNHQNIYYRNCSMPKTSLLRISEAKNYYLSMGGYGVYLLQKISNCNPQNDLNYYLDSEVLNTFNPCLRPTQSLYYDGITSSYPDDFIAGGLTNSTDNNREVFLDQGCYQITIWSFNVNDSEGQASGDFNSLNVYEKNVITIPAHNIYDIEKIEGFRIKSIKDFSGLGKLGTSKEYKYIIDLNSDNSSGVQLGFRPAPKVTSANYLACASMSSPRGICKTIPTITCTSEGIKIIPNIGYSSVFEITKDGTDINGYTQTKYNVGETGLIHSGSSTSFDPIYKNGKVTEKIIYDSNKICKTKEVITYDEKEFYFKNSISFERNSFNSYAYADSSNGWSLFFAQGVCTIDYIIASPNAAGPPDNFFDHDWVDGTLGKYSYHPVFQYIKGKFGYVSKKENYGFLSPEGELKQTEEFIYGDLDSEFPFQLVEKKITNTNEIFKSEKYQYHPDFPYYTNMITDIKYYNNEELIFNKKMVYSDFGTVKLVSEIKTAKGSNTLESRLLFDYDVSTKNITNTVVPSTAIPSNDCYDSYIFGYNDMYPVAKLSGVKYSQISLQRLINIRTLSSVTISPSSDLALKNELNLLRTDFPNAQITTFTFNPVIGVTSITDPKGEVQSFNYDFLGRLQSIFDKNGNKLSENEYHFKP